MWLSVTLKGNVLKKRSNWLGSHHFYNPHVASGQLMATGLWTLAIGLRAASSSTRMQHSLRWVGGWGLWARRWRCVMDTVTMVWRMISAAWDMTTMAWGLHPCTLEAMAPCHAWGWALRVWTDEDSGKIKNIFFCTSIHKIAYFETLVINASVAFYRSCEDTLDDMGGVEPYAWAVPMTMERGSMASLDSTLRKPPTSWRQPELPEVIAMLNYRLDPVKTNAAAFLQHLTFKNDKVKQSSQSCYLFLSLCGEI